MGTPKRYVIILSSSKRLLPERKGPVRHDTHDEAIDHAKSILTSVRRRSPVGRGLDTWTVIDMDHESGLPRMVAIGMADA